MVLEGNSEYELHLHPSDALTKSQKHYAATQLKLFKSWYRNWAAQQG